MYQSKKSKTKQFVTGLIGASLALSLAFAVTVKADTVSDLTAQINSLLATVSGLQSKLSTVQGGAPASSSSTGYSFSKDLSMGSSGADVMNLQKVLNMSADTQVSSTGAGSKGNETSKFGPATKAAVIKWQKKAGLPSTGYVGSLSRGKLNAMSAPVVVVPSLPGVITTAPVVQSGTGLTVSSPVQPAATIAPKATSRVPFTKVTLTAGSDGDVTVNSLTVQRTGLANDSAFGSIVLLDENGLQIGTSKTFNSNHQTTVGDPFVISRGTSKTLTIAGNMAADQTEYSGQVASLTVVGVNTSATVTGSLPIVGAGQTVNNSLTIGTAVLYVSQYDPASALSKNIGDTATKFSGIKVSAGSSEDVTLWSVRWNQTGSAGTTDLANVVTVLDGTSYPTTVSTDGKYYTTLFPNGIVIQKGFSKEFFIQGDIVGSGAASRTVEFDLYNASDLYVSGNTYNFGILSTANSSVAPSSLSATSRSRFTTGSPFYAGSIVTISAGTATTIGKAPTAAPATNIAVNVPNQILGAYETNIKGEPISVQSTVFHLNSSAAYASNLIPTSISLI
ncbi:MAG: peptidoglycan-binding protein, partial [Candidatus Taylorbacteria bacterium]|nr:peptidoglycan-binding protein [Candidatus Taylorbacteria bacterium]